MWHRFTTGAAPAGTRRRQSPRRVMAGPAGPVSTLFLPRRDGFGLRGQSRDCQCRVEPLTPRLSRAMDVHIARPQPSGKDRENGMTFRIACVPSGRSSPHATSPNKYSAPRNDCQGGKEALGHALRAMRPRKRPTHPEQAARLTPAGPRATANHHKRAAGPVLAETRHACRRWSPTNIAAG